MVKKLTIDISIDDWKGRMPDGTATLRALGYLIANIVELTDFDVGHIGDDDDREKMWRIHGVKSVKWRWRRK